MIKHSLYFITAFSLMTITNLATAEEPFIGLGIVSHNFTQEGAGSNSDTTASPLSYKITLGSRIAKSWLIEAYYLASAESDDAEVGTNTIIDIEYDSIFGASINYAYVTKFATLYGGPGISAAKLTGTVDSSNGALTDTEISALNDANDKDLRISPSIGIGADIKLFKKISLDFNAAIYQWESDIFDYGAGAELRYHM